MIVHSEIMMFFLLLIAHCLTDFPLQGDFLAVAKNKYLRTPGVPWWIAMAAHCLISAGGVYLVTSSLSLGLAEFGLHWWTDQSKNVGAFGAGERAFTIDQALHVVSKVAWVLIFVTCHPA